MDTWEKTDAALRVIFRAFDDLHDRKPDKKDTAAMAAWALEHRKVELYAHDVGRRRFALVGKK